MKKNLLHTLAVLVFAFGVCLTAEGHTYYVSNGGDNARSQVVARSSSSPWQTINHAISQSVNGDSVVVLSGTYEEAIVINKQIALVGDDGGSKPLLKGDGVELAIIQVGASNVVISNLLLEVDQASTVYGIWTTSSNVNGLRIEKNRILSSAFSGTDNCIQFSTMGIYLESIGTSSYTIKQNVIFTKTSLHCVFGRGIRAVGGFGTIGGPSVTDSNIIAGSYAIQLGEPTGGAMQIEQNHLYGRGIQLVDPVTNSGQHTIRNNRFDAGSPSRTLHLIELRGITNTGSSVLVDNNLFKNFAYFGVLSSRARNVTISNNTFTPYDTNTFICVALNTKQLTTIDANTQTAFANSATITGNIFNKPPNLSGGGAGIIVYNHNDVGGANSYSNVTIGTAAAPNTFKLGVKHNILLDTNSGPSKLFPYFEDEVPTAITNMSPTLVDLDITNNLFELTSGTVKPCAMTFGQQAELETRLFHINDNINLGFISYFSIQAPILGGTPGFCPGGSTVLRPQYVLQAGESFLWSDASTADSLLVSVAGNYTVRIVNVNGCISPESNVVTVSQINLTSPIITGSTSYCNGSNTTLTTNYTLGANESYVWSNGQSTRSIIVGTAGSYTLQIRNDQVGCESAPSNSLTVFGIVCPNTIVWTGGTSTNWFTTSNWQPNGTPVSTDSVIVPQGKPFYPSIVGSGVAKGLYIQTGASVAIDDQDTLSVRNTLTINGLLSGDGVLALRGSTQQVIGWSSLGKVLVDNPAGAKLTTPVIVQGYLKVNRGVLDVNNQAIVLSSDATRTGALGSVKVGDFTNIPPAGITTQRRLDPASAQATGGSWTYVTPPVSGLTADFWSTNNPYAIYTYVGAQPINSSFWLYDGNDVTTITNNGYVKASSGSQGVGRGVGARIWFRTSTFYSAGGTITAVGAPHFGDFSWSLNYCASGCAYPVSQGGTADNGWNLIGNPYMGPIDWEDASWVRNNVGLGTWIWRDAQQNFASYVAGVGGVNGGNNVISHHQGFFVQATGASPSLTVRPAAVASATTQAQPSFYRVGNAGKLRLTLRAANWSDEVLLVNNPAASAQYDGAEDGKKMNNPNLNLSFIGKDNNGQAVRTSINSYPLGQQDTIMLAVRANGNAALTLAVNELSLQGQKVALWDRMLDTKQVLNLNDVVAISNDPNNNRYALLIGNTVTSLSHSNVASFMVYPNPASGSLRIRTSQVGGTLKLRNLLGATVAETIITEGDQVLDISRIPAGVYHADLNGSSIKVVVR